MNNKERYIALVGDDVPFFHQPFWLNTVANDKWDVAFIERDNKLLASMPYYYIKKYGGRRIIMPLFTQFLGHYIAPRREKEKYVTKLSNEMDILNQLISQLPKFSYFEQRWNYKYQNWLPFYWKSFKQTTRYTYILDDLSSPDKIWENLRENIRRAIRKAEKTVKIEKYIHTEVMYKILVETYKRQNLKINFNETIIKKIINSCAEMNKGIQYIAVDSENKIHASILVVYDKSSAYFLMGGSFDEYKNSGAMSLLLWSATKDVSRYVNTFDFEGSMNQRIEHFFRSFGAKQTPYFEITKFNSSLLRFINCIKNP